MNAENRRKHILDKLSLLGTVSAKDLCGELSVTLQTIHNDFDALEKSEKIIRTFGGAILNEQGIKDAVQGGIIHNGTYANRISRFLENKIKIGSFAASLITDFDTVFLDAGTTVFQVLDGIVSKKTERLVVLTNSIYVSTYLMNIPDVVHYLMGGTVKSSSMATVGFKTIEEIKRNRVNKVFLGADGMGNDGFTVQDINESMTKLAMIDIAAEKYLLVDTSKISSPTFVEVAKFGVLDAVITENGIFYIDKNNIEKSVEAINNQKAVNT